MVENLIAGYLATGKRLVIPDLGAFLKKDTGETVFVEFLKKDDGVLSGLVAQSTGVSALEAASTVLQFSADIKTSLGTKGFYIVPRVGTLRRDNTGTINLAANPHQEEAAEPVVAKPAPAPEPVKQPEVPAEPEPVVKPRPVIAAQPVKPVTPSPATETPVSPRPKVTVENYSPARPAGAQRPSARPVSPPTGQKKKADLIMIIAIVAALIAIGSMVYGLMVNTNPINSIKSTQPVIEQPLDLPEDAAEE